MNLMVTGNFDTTPHPGATVSFMHKRSVERRDNQSAGRNSFPFCSACNCTGQSCSHHEGRQRGSQPNSVNWHRKSPVKCQPAGSAMYVVSPGGAEAVWGSVDNFPTTAPGHGAAGELRTGYSDFDAPHETPRRTLSARDAMKDSVQQHLPVHWVREPSRAVSFSTP